MKFFRKLRKRKQQKQQKHNEDILESLKVDSRVYVHKDVLEELLNLYKNSNHHSFEIKKIGKYEDGNKVTKVEIICDTYSLCLYVGVDYSESLRLSEYRLTTSSKNKEWFDSIIEKNPMNFPTNEDITKFLYDIDVNEKMLENGIVLKYKDIKYKDIN